MYKLYYVPDWASTCVRMVLEELEQAYETVCVDDASGMRSTEAYLKISPLGLVPALETPDGVMVETSAILLWLADRHQKMVPLVGDKERANFLKWLLFTNNTVHTQILALFHPERVSDPAASEATLSCARRQMLQALAILDEMVRSDRPSWFSAENPSILCYYLAVLMRWMNGYEKSHPAHVASAQFPNLHQMLEGLETRAAVLKVAALEGLGKTAFTNPTLV